MMMHHHSTKKGWLLAMVCAALAMGLIRSVTAEPLPALADVHLHYSWDHRQATSATEAVELLRQQNVRLAVVSSTPPELALTLRKAGGNWILPLYRPYLDPNRRQNWFNDPAVLPATRAALQSGHYVGIGEFHLIAGLGPRRNNPVVQGLIKLGVEFDVPVLIHIETSSHRYFLPLCQQYPAARFLLAHAGGLLDHKEIGALMQSCPNVWVEFSARDTWRYTRSSIVNQNGQLLPGWRKLIEKYPERFMVGSDPVWPVEPLHGWDEPDTGWQRLPEFLGFHRQWLAGLPAALNKKLRLTNAQHFFRQQGRETD